MLYDPNDVADEWNRGLDERRFTRVHSRCEKLVQYRKNECARDDRGKDGERRARLLTDKIGNEALRWQSAIIDSIWSD